MSCEFTTPKEVLDKVVEKGFAKQKMQKEYEMQCECGQKVIMDTYAKQCPNCSNIFAVTPCHSDDIKNIVIVRNS